MSGNLLELSFLKSIGLAVTYQCPISCAHCIVRAGPHRRDWLNLEEAFRWIKQIASYRNGHIKMLSLTGGEPFQDLSRLENISSFAKSKGLIVSAVTNAYWAEDLQEAIKVLKSLPSIRVLSISTDVYHQEFIPLEFIENALLAAKECGLSVNVHICADREDDVELKRTLDRLEGKIDKDFIFTSVTLPVGRALERLNKDRYQTSEIPSQFSCSSGSTPIIFPDGRILACCGAAVDLPSDHLLILGNIRENPLEDILDRAERNFILHAIRIWGPAKLISLAEEAGLGYLLQREYIKDSICSACYQLLSAPKVVDLLIGVSENPGFREKVAYARAYYLGEIDMIEALRIENQVNK
ncbi:MAG: radical SAM/SPASM domain-containing protein [Methanotrichaceae archaeon]